MTTEVNRYHNWRRQKTWGHMLQQEEIYERRYWR